MPGYVTDPATVSVRNNGIREPWGTCGKNPVQIAAKSVRIIISAPRNGRCDGVARKSGFGHGRAG